MDEFLLADGVYFSYNKDYKNFALKNIDLNIKSGEFVAIVGANGSGKSTLSRLLIAIFAPTKGMLYVDGVDVSDKQMIFKVRSNVGLVFQDPDNQIVSTVVEEDVAFALENLCVPQKDIEKKVDVCLKMVDMLPYKKSLVESLSGGQKSKIAVAGVLAMDPKCIIFDEATASLDPKSAADLLKIMVDLNRKKNTTIINITHKMNEVSICDRIVVLKDGNILGIGSARDIFSNRELVEKAKLRLPQVCEFMELLYEQGISKKRVVLDVDECVEILSDILKGEVLY